MDESFDDELQERLRQYVEEPRENLWHTIIARNNAEQRVFTMRERKRIGLMLIAGLLLLGGFEFLYNYETQSNGPAAHSPVPTKSITVTERLNERPVTPRLIPQHVIARTLPAPENHQVSNDSESNELHNQVSIPATEVAADGDGDDNLLLAEDTGSQNVNLAGNDIPVFQQKSADAVAAKNDSVSAENRIVKKNKPGVKETVLQKQNEKRNWPSLYFIVMPTFGYNSIKSNSNDNIIIESIERIPTFSLDRLGVRAEVGAEDPVTDRIKVFGGLVYYQRKQTIGYTEKRIEETQITQGPDGSIVVEPKFNYVEKSFEYELRNLGLQVGVNYQLSKKKFLQTAGTGIEFHVALNKLNHSSQSPEFTNNPSAYVFYNLYYRLQYPAEGRLKAVLQPTLNYSLYIDENLNAPFYVKPYGLGLNIGFTYNF